jgi:hypothetical protein
MIDLATREILPFHFVHAGRLRYAILCVSSKLMKQQKGFGGLLLLPRSIHRRPAKQGATLFPIQETLVAPVRTWFNLPLGWHSLSLKGPQVANATSISKSAEAPIEPREPRHRHNHAKQEGSKGIQFGPFPLERRSEKQVFDSRAKWTRRGSCVEGKLVVPYLPIPFQGAMSSTPGSAGMDSLFPDPNFPPPPISP